MFCLPSCPPKFIFLSIYPNRLATYLPICPFINSSIHFSQAHPFI